MAALVDVSGFDAAMDGIRRAADQKASAIANEKANEFCNAINYEFSVLSNEKFGHITDKDVVQMYDAENAKLIPQSHAGAHLNEIFHAEVKDGNDDLTKRVVVGVPENMTITEDVALCFRIGLKNAMKRTGH